MPVLAADSTVEAVAGSTRDVTERKQAEEALREASSFRQLANAMPQIVWSAQPTDGSIIKTSDGRSSPLPASSGNAGWVEFHPDERPESPAQGPVRWQPANPSRWNYVCDSRRKTYRWHLITPSRFGTNKAWCGGSARPPISMREAPKKPRFLAEASARSQPGRCKHLADGGEPAVPYFADWATVDLPTSEDCAGYRPSRPRQAPIAVD